MIATSRPVRLRRLLVSCVALAAITLAGCGDGDDATSSGDTSTTTAGEASAPDLSDKDFEDLTDQSEVAVQVRDNSFVADYIIVKAGTTVTWTNRGRTEHNVLPAVDGAFTPIEVQDLEPEMSASITFDEPGDYPYYCSLHGTRTKGMVGAVRVVA